MNRIRFTAMMAIAAAAAVGLATIELINSDPGTAQGLVITASGARSSRMPMMTARVAFPGSALWFLGDPTSAGMHAATLSFTATAPRNLPVPVPGPPGTRGKA